jgi:hypothetical protein
MTETKAETCPCGQPATTGVTLVYARHATRQPACEACAKRHQTRVQIEGRKPSEICIELDNILKAEGMGEEGIACSARWNQGEDLPITKWRWVSVFPVTGANEGHYIHIDLHLGYGKEKGKSLNVGILKTFSGWDKAWEVAKRIAFLLEA